VNTARITCAGCAEPKLAQLTREGVCYLCRSASRDADPVGNRTLADARSARRASWLQRIARRAATQPELRFAERVLDRLDAYRAEHGRDTFHERPLADLLVEIDEETLDTAAWSALAFERAAGLDLPSADRDRLVASLEAAAVLGAQASAVIAIARRAAAGAIEGQAA